MRKLLILALPLFLCGCLSSAKHDLDLAWRPLEEIRERPAVMQDIEPKGAITTIGKRCYVSDLDDWLNRYPPGSTKYLAVLRHEQEHSRRQLDTGVWSWVARYGVDKDFALAEEKIGFYYEMTERRRLGEWVNPETYARSLSKYKILSGSLISYDEALAWANDVFAGRWTPSND